MVVLIVLLVLSLLGIWISSKIDTSYFEIREAATVSMWSLTHLTLGDVFSIPTSVPRADLSPDIVSVGYVDMRGTFVPEKKFSNRREGALRIIVTNAGTKRSDMWRLTAEFPTIPPYVYISEEQVPLDKNEERVFILAFDNVGNMYNKKILVTIDTLTQEENAVNNTAEWDFSAVRETF